MPDRAHYDVVVIGVGSMGSAACWFLARRGYKVLGLEEFGINHDRGSHAGQSRLIRKAYFEHPDYVPLLERAYENWKLIESQTDARLYYRTGLLYLGMGDNENITGVRTSASKYSIRVEDLSVDAARQKVPAFSIPENFDAIFEPDAGFITPEATVRRCAEGAIAQGAVIKTNSPVLSWRKTGRRLEVMTEESSYTCDKLIITAGAWSSKVIPSLQVKLKVTKQVLAWVDTGGDENLSLGNLPCWLIEDPERGTYYGFPELPANKFEGPSGLKFAHHFPGEPCDADLVKRELPSGAEEGVRYFLRLYLPHLADAKLTLKSCLYTSSPDAHFIIDHLPGYDKRVTIACGFSGHGFKFVPVVGEILADLSMQGKTDLPIGFLGMGRLGYTSKVE